jgi:adenosine deaminase
VDTTDWIAALPKVELHLHLEGALRPETMFALAGRNGVELPADSPEGLGALYRFGDFGDFARLFLTGLKVLRTAADFADATAALAAELAAQNVRYAEVTTTPFAHIRRGVAAEEYRDGLNAGRRLARTAHGVELAWICDISRETEDPGSEETLGFLLGRTAPDGVVGLGLGGMEAGYPPAPFAASFAKAHANGLAALPHAGETVGPESVWSAVRDLHADRVAHGVTCLADPALVDHLAAHGIPLDIAITSNVLLGLAASPEAHPLGDLRRAGLTLTLNTDDPAYFGTTLTRELRIAHEAHGLDRAALVEAQCTALAVSYAPADVRARVTAELAAVTAAG